MYTYMNAYKHTYTNNNNNDNDNNTLITIMMIMIMIVKALLTAMLWQLKSSGLHPGTRELGCCTGVC